MTRSLYFFILIIGLISCGFKSYKLFRSNWFPHLYLNKQDAEGFLIPPIVAVLPPQLEESPYNSIVEIDGYEKNGRVINHVCSGTVLHIANLIATNAHCRALTNDQNQVEINYDTLTDKMDPIMVARTHWPSGRVRQAVRLGKPCFIGTENSEGDRDNDYVLYFLDRPLAGTVPLHVVTRDQLPPKCKSHLNLTGLMPSLAPNSPIPLFSVSGCRRETSLEAQYNSNENYHMIGTDCSALHGSSGGSISCSYGNQHFAYALEEGGGSATPPVPLDWKTISIGVPIWRMIPGINKCLKTHGLKPIERSLLPPPWFKP